MIKDYNIYVSLLIDITEKHLQLKPKTLNVKKKTEKLVLGRMIVTNILVNNGITPSKIASIFVKDRSSYYHYIKLHKLYINKPNMYPIYNKNYDAILQEFKERTHNINLKDLIIKLDIINDITDTVNILSKQKKLLLQTLTH